MGFRDGGDLYYMSEREKRLVTENWISVTEQRIKDRSSHFFLVRL